MHLMATSLTPTPSTACLWATRAYSSGEAEEACRQLTQRGGGGLLAAKAWERTLVLLAAESIQERSISTRACHTSYVLLIPDHAAPLRGCRLLNALFRSAPTVCIGPAAALFLAVRQACAGSGAVRASSLLN